MCSGPVGVVSAAWRYPVKSLAGERRSAVVLDQRGVLGDRMLGVYGADGKIGSGKSTRRFRRMTGLLECSARMDRDGQVPVSMPDGREFNAPSEEAAQALSEWLGEPVELRIEREVSHLDAAPVHILTSSSLAWLAARLGVDQVDVARFRPNLLVTTSAAGEGRPEDGWIGMTLTIGGAILEVTERAERCVMVTMAQPGLDADERILRLLAEENDACFGVYARVVQGGTVEVGASVLR